MLFKQKRGGITMKKALRILLSVCMAALLCVSALAMAGAADEPAVTTQKLYYDNYFTGWSEVYCYAWNTKGQNAEWPGELMTADEYSSCWMAEVDAAYTQVIFTDGKGLQTFDLTILNAYDTFYGTKVEQGKVNGYWRNYRDYTKYYFFPGDVWGETDCYASYWNGGDTPQAWPGVKMAKVENAYIFKMYGTQNLIINNGGNGKQTELLAKLTTNSMRLTGNITGQDQYGNDLYEVAFNTPGPG